MTNPIALVLACMIFAAILADATLNDGVAAIFMLKKLVNVIEYVQFWR